MKAIETKIPGVLIIETDIFNDERGYFGETYCEPKYQELGVKAHFVQDNMAYNKYKGTLRGMHWQNPPYGQAKLVSCSKGSVIDVAVDIRKGSPTYKQWVAVELSEENHRQFYLPRGFAHGYLTLCDDVEFRYKVDSIYNKASEGCMIYDDEDVHIDWGSLLNGIEPILSQKDKESPHLKDAYNLFEYREEEK